MLGALWLTLGPEPDEEARELGKRIEQVRSSVRAVVPADDQRSPTEGAAPKLDDEELSNILLFVPVGPLVALRWPRRWWAALPVGVGASAAIELAQMSVFTHRGPEWDDLRHNSVGTAIGAGVAGVVMTLSAWRTARKRPRSF